MASILGFLSLNAKIPTKSAKPSAQKDGRFKRHSTHLKSTVFRTPTVTNMNSKSTKIGIGPDLNAPCSISGRQLFALS